MQQHMLLRLLYEQIIAYNKAEGQGYDSKYPLTRTFWI